MVMLTKVHMIISMLHEIQPNEMPEFLAKNLNNVLPMNVDNFDMSRIITDMQTIQTKLDILQEAHETSLAAHVVLCNEPQSHAQEQTSGQSTAHEPNLIGPILQPKVTPVEVLGAAPIIRQLQPKIHKMLLTIMVII